MKNRYRTAVGLFLCFYAGWFWSCAPVQKTGIERRKPPPGPEFAYMYAEDEIFYAGRIIPPIEEQLNLYGDEFIQTYIQRVGGRLMGANTASDWPEEYGWHFKMVDSSSKKAFAVLGGHVFIYRGLVQEAESESELAGILALEAAHLLTGNIQQMLYERVVRQEGFSPGEIISGTEGLRRLEDVFRREGGALPLFSSMVFSPGQVEAADRKAVELLSKSGYNPHAYLNILRRLAYEQPSLSLWIKKTGWSEIRRRFIRDLTKFAQPVPEADERFGDFKDYLISVSAPAEEEIPKEAAPAGGEAVLRLKILGIADWVDTGLDVYEGQQIFFRASGAVSLQKGNPTAYSRPEGLNIKTFQQPLPEENFGALIGKVVQLISIEVNEETGEEKREEIVQMFFIGREKRVRMPIAGKLYLGINEDVVGDNSGEYLVEIFVDG